MKNKAQKTFANILKKLGYNYFRETKENQKRMEKPNKTLDEIQSSLWGLNSKMEEEKISYEEAKNEVHNLVSELEDVIDEHDIWKLKKEA